MRLTQQAHEAVSQVVGEGDSAVDATAGNGHDTLFLASRVGESGHVWGFDVQSQAIDSTRQRLQQHSMSARVTLIPQSHSAMARYLPATASGRIAAVMFNLGYLPGSDRAIVTRASSTVAALEQAVDWLRPGGLLSVLVYRGHAGGRDEWRAVSRWLSLQAVQHQCTIGDEKAGDSPLLVLVRR